MYIQIWSCLQDVKFGELIFEETKTRCFHYITGQVVPQAYTIREESMLVPQSPCIWCMKLEASGSSGCGCLCEVVGDWDVNKVVNYPIQNGDLDLRSAFLWRSPANPLQHCQKNTTGTAVHFLGCHRCVLVPYNTWLFQDGPFLDRSLCSAQSMLEVLAFFAAWWTRGDHDVYLWRNMPVYLAVGTSVSVAVSRVGGIYWRLIAGDTQQLALLWMEGHKPLLFPILYHILKFIRVSLGTDFYINEAVHNEQVWCVMGVLAEDMRWSTQGTTSEQTDQHSSLWYAWIITWCLGVCAEVDRWSCYTRNNIDPSTVPCGMHEVTGLVCDDFPSVWSRSKMLKWSDFIQEYSHGCRI